MKVAAIQMTSGVDVARNLATAQRLLREAAGAGAQLAVLPENFALMSRQERDKRAIAEPDGRGPIQDMLCAAARQLNITVVGGTIPLLVPGETRVAAASLVYGPDGSRLGRYDKIHLFDVNVPGAAESHRESAGMTPGREVVVVSTPVGRVGVAVCYDLRFPELFRRMMDLGADSSSYPRPLPCPPARRTGACCCVRARSRTSATSWPPPRWGNTRTAARPMATAW